MKMAIKLLLALSGIGILIYLLRLWNDGIEVI